MVAETLSFVNDEFRGHLLNFASSVVTAKDLKLDRFVETVCSGLVSSEKKTFTSFEDAEAHLLEAGIRSPFPTVELMGRYPFELLPVTESDIHYWIFGACKGVNSNVEVYVDMSTQCINERDYLNFRYFYKRALFISFLALRLKRQRSKLDVKFSLLDNDVNRPVIVVVGEGMQVTVRPSLPPKVIPAVKLGPKRNSVRKPNEQHAPPTPYYNNSLLKDIYEYQTACELAALQGQYEGLTSAMHLVALWLQVNEFSTSVRRFVFALMHWLTKVEPSVIIQRFQRQMNAYQLFKLTLDFIANHRFIKASESDWENFGDPQPVLFLTKDGLAVDGVVGFGCADFETQFDAICVDTSGHFNWLDTCTLSDIDLLQFCARRALMVRKVEPLFTENILSLPSHQFDYSWKLALPQSIASYTEKVQRDRYWFPQFLYSFVSRLLRRGLSKRARLVYLGPLVLAETWNTDDRPVLKPPCLTLGVVLNTDFALEPVTFGPPADKEKEAKFFRQLWGSVAEMRRFADGSILEAVVWKTGSASSTDGNAVNRKIVEHLLRRHIYGGSTLPEITSRNLSFRKLYPSGNFGEVMQCFQQFSKRLRNLQGFPLSVKSVQPCSSGLYYSSLDVPKVDSDPTVPHQNEPLEVILTFESSSRWPDEIEAVQTMKLALLQKLESLLLEPAHLPLNQFGKRTSHVSEFVSGEDVCAFKVEKVYINTRSLHEPECAPTSHMDVLLSNKLLFRVYIHYEQEPLLLQRCYLRASEDFKPEVERAMELYHQKFYLEHFVATAVSKLSQFYPYLSDSIRLCKAWLDAQWLASDVPDRVTELVCCWIFLDTESYLAAPATAEMGLLRYVNFWATFSFEQQFIELNLTDLTGHGLEGSCRVLGALSDAERSAAQRCFNKVRTTFKKMERAALFIATNRDVTGQAFSWLQPSRHTVRRLQFLGRKLLRPFRELADPWEVDGRLITTTLWSTDKLESAFPFVCDVSSQWQQNGRTFGNDEGAAECKYRNLEIHMALTRNTRIPAGMSLVDQFCDDVFREYGNAVDSCPFGVYFSRGQTRKVGFVIPAKGARIARYGPLLNVKPWLTNGGQAVLTGTRSFKPFFWPPFHSNHNNNAQFLLKLVDDMEVLLTRLVKRRPLALTTLDTADLKAKIKDLGKDYFA